MEKQMVKIGYGYIDVDEFVKAQKNKKKEFINSDPKKFYSVSSVSLKTGIGRNNIYAILRKFNYINEDNFPFPKYVDEGYFDHYPFIGKSQTKSVLQISLKGIDLLLSL